MKILKMSNDDWNSMKSLKMKNVCRDFYVEAKIIKKVPSGFKVAWANGHGPTGVTYQVKIAKRDKQGDLWVSEGGSVCNNYVVRG